MWKLYVSGREGVAIKTTASSLIQLLSNERELKLGRVEYSNIEGWQRTPDVFAFEQGRRTGATLLPIELSIFRKNPGHKHEQEVRALIYETYDAAQRIVSSDQLENLTSSMSGGTPPRRTGVSVNVDISTLIHRIVVSPGFPRWAVKSLQKTVDTAFGRSPTVAVETAVLLEAPPD